MEGASQGYAGPSNGRDYGRGTLDPAGMADMPLDQVASRLNEAIARIDQNVIRVGKLADGLFGPRVEKEGPGGPTRPSRSGRVGSLQDQSDAINGALSVLENQIARLDLLAG